MKRLHSSYNLIRLVLSDEDAPLSDEDDPLSDDSIAHNADEVSENTAAENLHSVANGLLMALLMQEFVNNREHNAERLYYQNWLTSGAPDETAKIYAALQDNKEHHTFTQAMALVAVCGQWRFDLKDRHQARRNMIELCRLYVLPAIAVEGNSAEGNSAEGNSVEQAG